MKCIDDEIPFEIPQSWCWVRGKHIFLPMQSIKPTGEYFTYIDIDAVNNKVNIIDKAKNILCSQAPSRASRKLEANSILFSMVRPYLRNITMVGEEYKDAIASTGFYVVTPSMLLFTKYIFNLLLSSYVVDGLNQFMKGDNSPSINNEHIEGFLYPVPPVNEQIKIVAKIEKIMPFADKYEESQEALNKLNAGISDKLRKSVLQEAIQGKLVPQDPNDEPASVLLERIKEEKTKLFKEGKLKKKDLVDSVIFKGDDNKYYEKVGSQVACVDDEIPFEIPSSWSWIRLGNYTDVIGGYAFQSQDLKSENGCRVIRISDISEDGLVNTRIVRYNGNLELSQYRIYNSDILMAMTGGTVGKSLLIKSDNKEVLLLNQRVAIIRNTWFDVNYIDTVIKSAYIKSIIDNSKNSTNDNISMADITGFLIPIPPLNEQHRIINKLEFVIASIMRR